MDYTTIDIGNASRGSSITKQLRALFLKNLSLQLQYKKTNLFLFILPALIVIILGLMALMLRLSQDSEDNSYFYSGSSSVDANNPYGNWIWGYYVNAPAGNGIPAGNLSSEGYKQGFLGYIPQYNLTGDSDYPPEYQLVPFFEEAPSAHSLDKTIQKAEDDLISHYSWDSDPAFKYTGSVPIAALEFNKLNPQNLQVDYIVQRDSKHYMDYALYMPYLFVYPSDSETMPIFTYYVHSAMLNYYLNTTLNTTIEFDFVAASWYTEEYTTDGFNLMMALFMLPFGLCLGIPFISFMLVTEKSTKFLEMMKIMGLRMRAYWLINMLYFSTVWFVSFIGLYVISLAFGTPWAVHTSPLVAILLFLCWSISATCFGMFWAQLFNRPLLASGSLAAIVVVMPEIAALLAAAVWSKADSPPWFFVIFPPNTIVWGVWLMNRFQNGVDNDFATWTSAFTSQMSLVYIILLGQAVVCILLTHYLFNIMPREFGVTYSWTYPVTSLIDFFKTKQQNQKAIRMATPSGPEDATDSMDEEYDCKEERRRASDMSKSFPVRLIGLRKVYEHHYKMLSDEVQQVALKNFCLALDAGECFGLLGPNGAGKSTVMNILTGLTKPTSGYAMIQGFNTNTHVEQVHQMIGFCPQFDVLWNELTVEDHLLFYMRLKGSVPRSMEKQELQNIVTRLRLTFSKQKIGQLSGGQKRRVSIAVAFVGDSKLILLDEPTTGLDLSSRQEIWNLINEQKVGRSILLTTHNMQEADALCTRIGIMSQGKLLCIDQPNYLKSRYGKGFKLSVTPSRGNSDKVQQTLMSKYPSMRADTSFASTLRFFLDSEQEASEQLKQIIQIQDVVEDLISIKKESLVADWTISQCSLEEVFLNLIHEDELGE